MFAFLEVAQALACVVLVRFFYAREDQKTKEKPHRLKPVLPTPTNEDIPTMLKLRYNL
jgi:hypothetical protein